MFIVRTYTFDEKLLRVIDFTAFWDLKRVIENHFAIVTKSKKNRRFKIRTDGRFKNNWDYTGI